MDRRRSVKVGLGVTAVVAAGVIAYGSSAADPDYASVCVDPATSNRVEDARCDCVDPDDGSTYTDDTCRNDTHRHSGHWMFIPYGGRAPALGSRVSGFADRPPSGHSFVRGGVSSAGGTVGEGTVVGGKTVFRGGFGGFGKVGG